MAIDRRSDALLWLPKGTGIRAADNPKRVELAAAKCTPAHFRAWSAPMGTEGTLQQTLPPPPKAERVCSVCTPEHLRRGAISAPLSMAPSNPESAEGPKRCGGRGGVTEVREGSVKAALASFRTSWQELSKRCDLLPLLSTFRARYRSTRAGM
jgi:hypothetical protein